MATKESKQWWDPYETSHRRQFIYQPNSATEIVLCPTSTSFIDSYSRSGPFGSTVYNKDFYWKPAHKTESIRTGTASGQRRHNPHPSQSFMMWRLPRDATRSPEYVRFPCKYSPSAEELSKALTAQYHSTYRCDYMGMPQGSDQVNSTERRLAPLHSRRHVQISTETEMSDNYRQPKQRPELLGDRCQHSCKPQSNMTHPGIVPTVVQRHIRTQQKRSDLTTYDRFCGKRVGDVTSVMKSLLPMEVQHLNRILPEDDKDAIKHVLSRISHPNNEEKGNKLPTVNSCSPEWMSSWTGPL